MERYRNPLFSVILPTRDRPRLFSVALQSVLDQTCPEVEIIIVDDGSDVERAAQYRAILEGVPARVRSPLILPQTRRGHGHGFAVNTGAARAQGQYLCFLDDDDQWTDPGHLARVADAISASVVPPDLVLANQRAFRNGEALLQEVWIEDLAQRLADAPDRSGAYEVTPVDLLRCQSFCHLNTTIVARALYFALGGLDEGLRYEEDRDFFLRAIDRARLIKFLPPIVSQHNIPDPRAGTSVSTSETELTKRLYQLRVFDKAALFATRPELRRYALRHRAYILSHIANEAVRTGKPDSAAFYRREAWLAKLLLRWRTLAGG